MSYGFVLVIVLEGVVACYIKFKRNDKALLAKSSLIRPLNKFSNVFESFMMFKHYPFQFCCTNFNLYKPVLEELLPKKKTNEII